MQPPLQSDQAEVIAFMRSPAAFPGRTDAVETFETHGAYVFAAANDAYKIKRAVHFSYMDFSTLELRRQTLIKELAINVQNAPELYLGVVPITREADGSLRISGQGTPIEWALHMRRFDQAHLLSTFVAAGGLDRCLSRQLADVVLASHSRAEPASVSDGAARISKVIASVRRDLAELESVFSGGKLANFERLTAAAHAKASICLDARAAAGCIRRCHGDLHLRNIVLWHGKPTLFDALEFNDTLATIDTLYDLAFLLMDLDHRGLNLAANAVLNHYLSRSDRKLDIDGLVAMPLFLGLRSAIRALVEAQRSTMSPSNETANLAAKAQAYFDHALRYLEPPTARLVAVGGLSGTGKSTLAAAIAPHLLPTPGALHIRSDLERKAMLGVAPTHRLPSASYTQSVSDKVYARVLEKAHTALEAGHSVVVDAVFSKPAEREAAAGLARELGVPFAGLWLTAPRDTLLARVAARRDDASDATPAVVEAQLAASQGPTEWIDIDAGGTSETTFRNACRALTETCGIADLS